MDLLLKPSCGGCGSTTDLYGSNCKHMTLCLTCGKTMAESKAKCFDCGATITRLIRVRFLYLSSISPPPSAAFRFHPIVRFHKLKIQLSRIWLAIQSCQVFAPENLDGILIAFSLLRSLGDSFNLEIELASSFYLFIYLKVLPKLVSLIHVSWKQMVNGLFVTGI